MKRRSLGLGYLGFAFAGPAFGHHGSYEYDLSVTEEYEGVIVEHIWKNPHTLTVLETRSESGEPLRLEIEGGGPSGLRTLGVTVKIGRAHV